MCENKDFCNVIMPSEDTKILEFNQHQKSDKVLFVIYAELACLIEKNDGWFFKVYNIVIYKCGN